jgi:hypothetical protein
VQADLDGGEGKARLRGDAAVGFARNELPDQRAIDGVQAREGAIERGQDFSRCRCITGVGDLVDLVVECDRARPATAAADEIEARVAREGEEPGFEYGGIAEGVRAGETF